ncbi:MAG TPA: hypothetical protein V6D10_19100 [Trichocoleus sp.]|jgi:hypothetical protein
MNLRSPGFENLKPEILKECVAELHNINIHDQEIIQLVLAQTIIVNTLGGDFWAKECTSFGDRQAFFAQKSDVRVIHLANTLWYLKDCLGFREFVAKNDNNSFEATYYEAVAAYWFLRESHSIQLVIPSQVRGQDFDIKVAGFKAREDLNVEVKARKNIFRTESQALDFLKSHRTQLPRDQKGIIFCKIETGQGTIDQNQLISATQKFLRDTNRVKFAVYCWDSLASDNAIAIACFSVNSDGLMEPIFSEALQPLVPAFMSAAGL